MKIATIAKPDDQNQGGENMAKRILFVSVVLFLVLALALPGPASAQQKKRFFGIATGGVGGVYYPVGGALAQALTNTIPDMVVTAQTGNASVANVNLIARGEVESGIAQNNIALAAWAGEKETWKTPQVKTLRCISALFPETTHTVALAKSNIKTVYDLKGKRLIVGDKGSGTEFDSRRFLEAMGLSYDVLQPIYVYYAAAVQRMQDEQADALFWTAGVPISSIIEIATTKDVTFVPFPDEVIQKLQAKYPYYTKVTLPAKAYPKQNNPVQTVAIVSLWVTNSTVDEKAIYDVTSHLWEKKPQVFREKKDLASGAEMMAAAHEQGKNVKFENALLGVTIPLHIGAYKYYKEKGVQIPPALVPPEAK
ncbi:MAG: family transporter solute receptor [Deltaproteobacteria bacterium]|nr:family transporter solute receptor [Deltaproteobacteria bacterium]MBP1718332.1 family transporter solute receptor [Deltaproteobacteria bacterium]